MQGRPRRSVLYMPGSNERALEKAKTIPADALIFDLEDAVTPNAKPLARDQVCAAVRNGDYGGREIVIRVNALETPWGTDDLLAACEAAPDAILVPKVAHPGDIISAAKILQGVHAAEEIRLWAMMETPWPSSTPAPSPPPPFTRSTDSAVSSWARTTCSRNRAPALCTTGLPSSRGLP
jgi:citrate lyase subunit beta/citryl-CoA lyase